VIGKEKRLIYEKQADVIKSFCHPLRIAIIDFLKSGEQCVCDIADYIGAERSNVSRHLSVMVSAGVLESRKEGLKVIYSLKTPCIVDCLSCISECLKQQLTESQKMLKAL
jgi:ArsR family transcriptional regulator